MTLDEHICSGGVATVPDLRGDGECYSDDYDSLTITQTPAPGELVGAGQTIINVLTEDKSGNATLCTHYLNVTADNPAPTLICPENITAWLLTGGYEVPNFLVMLEVIGGCTVFDDLVITQSPPAGTKLTTAGTHTITITVADEFGHEVTCGSVTITLKNPGEVPGGGGGGPVIPPQVPVTIPTYIYTVNLLAYWPLDDRGFLNDVSAYVLGGSGSGRDFTNGGAVSNQASQTILESSCHPTSPGPIFGSGSAHLNRSNTAYLTRADDTGLRLAGASWTMRFGFRLVSLDQFGPEVRIISKMSTPALDTGYRMMVTRLGGANNWMRVLLNNISLIGLDTGYVSIPSNAFTLITVTFDDPTGALKIYTNGTLQSTATNMGFHLSGAANPFRVGDSSSGSTAEFYVDELGIWSEAWTADRVMQDYQIVRCLL